MRFGEGWQQPPCPVSPTPAPPCLPLKRGEPHRQLGLLLATPGKAVVMGPGHCPAGTTYAVSQSPPRKGQDAGQGRRGDARTHKCTGTDTGTGIGAFTRTATSRLFTGEETEAHGVERPAQGHSLDFRATPSNLSRSPSSAETARKGPRRAHHHAQPPSLVEALLPLLAHCGPPLPSPGPPDCPVVPLWRYPGPPSCKPLVASGQASWPVRLCSEQAKHGDRQGPVGGLPDT